MRKIKISKKGIYIISSFIILSVAFLFFIYAPKRRQANLLKKQLVDIQQELESIVGAPSNGSSLKKFIGALREKTEYLNNMFPATEEEAIKNLSRLASRYRLNILSVNSTLEDIDAKELVSLKDKTIKKVYLDISLVGDYMSLGRFLYDTRENFKNFVALDKLQIEKPSAANKLKIELKLSLYLII